MSMRYPGGLIATSPVNARYPSGVWTQAQAAPYQAQNVWTRDQFWPYITLLLQGDGAVNGAQNNTFLDSSSNNFTITRNGNTTQGAFTPYEQDGYWSNYFDGASDLRIASNAAFAPGTGNFTFEMWINPPSWATAAPIFVVAGTGGLWIGKNNSNFVVRAYGVADQLQYATMPTTNTWTHIVAVRSGTTLSMYYNGSRVATTTNSYNFAQAAAAIGSDADPTNPAYYTGYISNLRLVKGTAVYDPTQTTITVPANPITAVTNTSLLTCQSNRFRDNSTNNFTVTPNGASSVQAFQPFPGATTWSASVLGGSGYFDGSGDFLDAASNAAFGYGTGDFQFDYLVYLNNKGSSQTIQEQRIGIDQAPVIDIGSDGSISYYKNASSGTLVVSAGSGSIRWLEWSLITVSRVSGTSRIFVNGVSLASAADSTNYAQAPLRIGANLAGGSGVSGYIAQCRVVKGSGVSSTFTPSYPLTAISGTSVLLNFTNAGIFDAAAMNDLETVGNAQVSTSVVKYGTGSMAFDGNGDYLVAPSRATTSLEGDFTIEYWIYRSVSGTTSIFTLGDSFTASGIETYIGSSGTAFLLFSGNATRISSSTLPAVGAWSHVAVVRLGSTITLYLNGISLGTWSSSTTFSGAVYVGTEFYNGSVSGSLNGYLDDLRITKAARYITNFTPPPARMPGQ